MIHASDKVKMPPCLAQPPLLPSNHHRRDSNQARVGICEDYKELMGSTECPPPTEMPRKRLKYAVAWGAIQETIPCCLQIGDTFPPPYSSRAKSDRAGFQRRPLLFPFSRIDGAGQGRNGQTWLNGGGVGNCRINRIRQSTSDYL